MAPLFLPRQVATVIETIRVGEWVYCYGACAFAPWPARKEAVYRYRRKFSSKVINGFRNYRLSNAFAGRLLRGPRANGGKQPVKRVAAIPQAYYRFTIIPPCDSTTIKPRTRAVRTDRVFVYFEKSVVRIGRPKEWQRTTSILFYFIFFCFTCNL